MEGSFKCFRLYRNEILHELQINYHLLYRSTANILWENDRNHQVGVSRSIHDINQPISEGYPRFDDFSKTFVPGVLHHHQPRYAAGWLGSGLNGASMHGTA